MIGVKQVSGTARPLNMRSRVPKGSIPIKGIPGILTPTRLSGLPHAAL